MTFDIAGFVTNSDNFDSHLLTGDDAKRFKVSKVTIYILTHISSPEMTIQRQYFYTNRDNFDSHLLTGDDDFWI